MLVAYFVDSHALCKFSLVKQTATRAVQPATRNAVVELEESDGAQ